MVMVSGQKEKTIKLSEEKWGILIMCAWRFLLGLQGNPMGQVCTWDYLIGEARLRGSELPVRPGCNAKDIT